MILITLEKVKVVSKEGEYTDSFSHSRKPLFLATTWLNEKPQTTPLFLFLAESNVYLIILLSL